MRIIFSARSWTEYLQWQSDDPAMLAKMNELIRDISRQPFGGLGKPEPLKSELSDWWSRRLSGEHRLVYRVTGSGDAQSIEIAACRHHYKR